MTIEEAIKQKKPFPDHFQRALVNLIYTSNEVEYALKKALKKQGVTMQQYNVLRILRGAGGPVSTSVIRERLLDKKSDTSRIVERLVQKGWVKKFVCPADKRLVDVSLTPAGEAFLDKINLPAHIIRGWFKALTEAEVEQLNALLDKVRKSIVES